MDIAIRGLRGTTMIIAATLLAGCAFGTRHPTLIYPPAVEPSAITAVQAAAKPAPKKMQIILGEISDQRSDKNVVGTMRNFYGIRTADVIPTNSVPDWVMQAIKIELQNDGYAVQTESTGGDRPTSARAVVSGQILNVFCDVSMRYTAQVSLLARVSRDGKEVLNKQYQGEGSAGIIGREPQSLRTVAGARAGVRGQTVRRRPRQGPDGSVDFLFQSWKSALGCGFNRSTQQIGEIVQLVFRSLESFSGARSIFWPRR